MTTWVTPAAPTTGSTGTSTWADQVAVDLGLIAGSYVFIGRQATPQTLTTSVVGNITLDTEDFDTYGGHSTSSNTDQYVVPAALNGYRLELFGTVLFTANATGERTAAFTQNATTVPGSVQAVGNAATLTCSVQCFAPILVATGDVLRLVGEQTSGGNLATIAGSRFAIKFAGLT